MRQARRGRPPRKARMSKEDMAMREGAIIDDIRAGLLSYREIAAKHGVSLPTVNNKARKAGISRGRRKGARIVVAAPRRKAARKAGGRKAGTRRKVAARRTDLGVDMIPPPTRVGRPRRKVRRGTGRGPGRPRGTTNRKPRTGFADALRELVLQYYPTISLQKFVRLSQLIEGQAA